MTSALLALHTTDPASVYLSVFARSATSTLADVSAAMYDRRALVRWMAALDPTPMGWKRRDWFFGIPPH